MHFDEFAQLLKASAKKKKENQEYKDEKERSERMDFCFQVNQVTVSKLMNIKLPLNFFVFL